MQFSPTLLHFWAEEAIGILAGLALRLHVLSVVHEAVASADAVMRPGSFKVLPESSEARVFTDCWGWGAEVRMRQRIGREYTH